MKRHGVQSWRWRVWAGLVFLIGLLGAMDTASAQEERTFTLNNVDVRLADVSAEADVYFRSMRLNRALDVWNVEASVSNKVGRVISGPLVLLVEGFTNTTGPRQADGTIEGEKQYYDFSGLTPNGALAPGEVSAPRTLTLGRSGSGSPALDTRVYAGIAQASAALGVTRSLNAAGQPLPGVRLSIAGPSGAGEQSTDGDSGVSSFGQGAGEHVVKFSAEGYLPVWRRQTLLVEATTLLPNPRLTRRLEHAVSVTPLGGTVVKDSAETIAIEFGAGAVSQGAEVRLTPVTGQSLPAFLPLGWSPLNAFWLESTVPLGSASASLKPSGAIGGNETAVLVRWDEVGLRWIVLRTVAGNGSNPVAVNLEGAGAYALVVGDAGETSPPPVRVGEPLAGFILSTVIDASGLSARGIVTPLASPAKPHWTKGNGKGRRRAIAGPARNTNPARADEARRSAHS